MLFECLDTDIKIEYANINQLNLSNILHQINRFATLLLQLACQLFYMPNNASICFHFFPGVRF